MKLRSLILLGSSFMAVSQAAAQRGENAVADTTRPRVQTRAGESAWKLIVQQDSVRVRYLFYPLADSENNGVVFRLDNLNAKAILYRFEALFRGEGREASAQVEGRLDAFQSVTGDADGLFFIPFPDSGQVSELGLRGFRITPVD